VSINEIQWRVLTNDATTNKCYNEQFLSITSGCYNEYGGILSVDIIEKHVGMCRAFPL